MVLREVLHAHIPVLTPTSTVRDAVDKMDVYQFNGLVVIDQDHSPVGIVTEGDLARAVPSNGSISAIASQPAFAFGSKNPTCASPNMEVSDALHRMLMSGLTLLPIVEEGRLLGVVMRVDLMQALLCDLEPAQ